MMKLDEQTHEVLLSMQIKYYILSTLQIIILIIEHRGRVGNNTASYYGGPEFKLRPGDWMSYRGGGVRGFPQFPH
jgi:hypothetical protein